MLATCKNCKADLHLDRSDTGPGGWLGLHDPKTTHPMDQNSTCCPGTQDEHEPEMETCFFCYGLGCFECDDTGEQVAEV